VELIIRSDEGYLLYGHQLMKLISQSKKLPKQLMIEEGITPQAYVAYLRIRFGDVKEVKDLVASKIIKSDLLEAISDRIELPEDAVKELRRLSEIDRENG
jgi:hypothetical protein